MARDVSHIMFCTTAQAGGASSSLVNAGGESIEFLDYEVVHELYKENRLAQEIANLYSVSVDVVERLAGDPDHGGKATVSSYIETMVALELERDGVLGATVSRGPSMTDLVDGWERKWDVKAPPVIPGIPFSFEDAIKSVNKKFNEFPNGDIGILLCISFLNSETYLNLQKELRLKLTQNERFRVRQVTIDAFPECRGRA